MIASIGAETTVRSITVVRSSCRIWVKPGKPQCEHMFSALPLRADIAQRSRYVRFVPLATIRTAANSSLFDHFVGESQQCRRDREPERLCGLHVDHQLE